MAPRLQWTRDMHGRDSARLAGALFRVEAPGSLHVFFGTSALTGVMRWPSAAAAKAVAQELVDEIAKGRT